MRKAPRIPLSALALLLLLASLGAGAARGQVRLQSEVRLQTEAEPVTIAMVDGGVSLIELLEELGETFAVDVVFDPRLRDGQVEIALRDAGPEEAFDRVALAAGLMWLPLDERSVLFAEDNPQMRRRYEPQVVQTFYLENARLADVMTLLRSTMGARSLTAVDRLRALTVRDTVGRVALAEQLVRRHDRAPAILEVDVRLLRLTASALDRVGGGDGAGTLPSRLEAEAASAVAAVGRIEAQPILSLADGTEAVIGIGPGNGGDPAFELTLEGRFAPADGTITLEARIEGDSAGGERRHLTSTQRLDPGETWAVAGLLRSAGASASEADHLVVLLTPRVASPPTVEAADREPLRVGTEAALGLESDR